MVAVASGRLLKHFVRKNIGGVTIAKYSVSGPASYSAGGFTVTIDEVKNIEFALVQLRQQNNAYRISYSFSDNTVTIQVFEISADTTTGAISATEVAAGTDLSGLNFDIIVVGW